MSLVSWAETPTPNNHSQLMFILTLLSFPVLTFSRTMWSRRNLPDCPVHVICLPNANHRCSQTAGPSCSADQPAPEPRGSVLRTHSFSSPISPSCPQRESSLRRLRAGRAESQRAGKGTQAGSCHPIKSRYATPSPLPACLAPRAAAEFLS